MSQLLVSYWYPHQLKQQTTAWRDAMLGAAVFGREPAMTEIFGVHVSAVHSPVVGQADGLLEIWRSTQPVTSGQRGAIYYRHDQQLLFGSLEVAEHDYAVPHTVSGGTPLQAATESAFQQIFALIDSLRFPHLLRVWNYFADINQESLSLERYRQFNVGRQAGFVAAGRSLEHNLPSACALGVSGGPLVIYFIAGRNEPVAVENPRQVSAFHYPAAYGPKSPSFSRASLVRVGEQEMLFVSGTSSIVGHRSVHVGDVVAQTNETLVNIEAVVQEANRLARRAQFDCAKLCFKVYLRRPEDRDVVHATLVRALGADIQAFYLQADVCRHDLLVEIEATGGIPAQSGHP